jgi:hypothetical protein
MLAWPLRASIAVYFVAAIGLLLVTIQMAREIIVLRRQAVTGNRGVPSARRELAGGHGLAMAGGVAVGAYFLGFI